MPSFFIRPEEGIPVARYDFDRLGVTASTNRSRPLSGRLTLSTGSFYGGERTEMGGDLQWTPGPHLTLIGTVDRNPGPEPQGGP